MNIPDILSRIAKIRPENRVTVLNLQYGPAIKIEGEGSKALANYFCKELYVDGELDTKWRDVRHGLGYVIPLYEAPMPCF
jgi:hypothetical protein